MVGIAHGLCGLNIVSAHEVGALGCTDEVQLRFAASQDLCLVTRNRNDLFDVTLAAYEAQSPHAGVLIVPWSFPGDHFHPIATALCAFADRFPGSLPAYTITLLPHPS